MPLFFRILQVLPLLLNSRQGTPQAIRRILQGSPDSPDCVSQDIDPKQYIYIYIYATNKFSVLSEDLPALINYGNSRGWGNTSATPAQHDELVLKWCWAGVELVLSLCFPSHRLRNTSPIRAQHQPNTSSTLWTGGELVLRWYRVLRCVPAYCILDTAPWIPCPIYQILYNFVSEEVHLMWCWRALRMDEFLVE